MPLFVSTKPVSVPVGVIEVTLNVFTELSVGRAIAAQAREGSDDFFEQGIGLLLSYVESWSEPEPFEEATLRRLSLSAFEALVVAVSDAIAPAQDPDPEEVVEGPEAVSPN